MTIRTTFLLALASTLIACGGSSSQVLPTNSDEPFLLSPHARVDTGPGTGVTGGKICCHGMTVYAVYEDDRNDPGGNDDIYFNVSTDGGRTWLAQDIRLDTDLPGAADSDNPVICCAGQRVYVAWDEKRNGEQDVYFNSSADGGVTWQTSDRRLDTDDPGNATSAATRICCDGSNVYVGWWDERTGENTRGLFVNASSDGGLNWFADDVRVDTSVSIDVDQLRICCVGTRVHVAFKDAGNGVLLASRSLDGGQSWTAKESSVSTIQRAPTTMEMCCDGDNIYVVWQDDGDFPDDIYCNSSLDAGATWQTATRIDRGFEIARDPKVCCQGHNVYVTWSDRRHGGDEAIYFSRSSDGGLTWLVQDVRIDDGLGDCERPQICCDAQRLYIVWRDHRLADGKKIFVDYSDDGGATWLSPDIRADTHGPGDNVWDPRACCGDGVLFMSWRLTTPTGIQMNRIVPDGTR